jgi:hypothetical protein
MSPSAAIFKRKRRKVKRATSFYTKEAIAEKRRETDKHLFGSLGGASSVKKIDPHTGAVVEIIDPETGVSKKVEHSG